MTNETRLLVVDDEADVADLIREVAEGMGFCVAVANDGYAFDEAYRRFRPAVIFLDLKLPGYDGIELLRYLAEEQCRATIFIVSGADPRTLAAAQAVGAEHKLKMGPVLPKPLMVDRIETSLSSLSKESSRVDINDVRRAIANDEIRVHFQPKIDLLAEGGTKMIGVEALARWALPDGGWVFPDQFIPVVREAGLMRELTDLVVEKSLGTARTWHDGGLDLAMSINLDGSTLDDRSLPDAISEAARRWRVPERRITLEVTESAAMEAPAATMDILTRFRLKDFNVSLDDFGTGYSSLVQLYRLPFNELKIDKSFVMDIGINAEAGVIVGILALLGKKLGLAVCAEGIETGGTLKQVRETGCDLGQGYLFSRPVEGEAIPNLAVTLSRETIRSGEVH